MRVLHISTSVTGGAGTAAIRASEALNSIGVDSDLIHIYKGALDNDKSSRPIYRSKIDIFKSKAITVLQRFLLQKNSNLITPISMTLESVLNEVDDYDVIHLHSTYNLLSMSGLEKLLAKKEIFVTLHDQRWFTGGCHYAGDCLLYQSFCSTCPQGTNLGKLFIRRNFEKELAVVGGSSHITFISPSEWLASRAAQSRLLQSKEIHVVRNPIPTSYFESLPIADLERKGMEKRTINVGFIAEDLQNPLKGLSVLLKAWKLLSVETSQNMKLILIGNNPPEKVNLPTDTSVFSAQASNDVQKYLEEFDVLIVPSYQDNLPNVIGEAYALGKKVIGSRVGGIPEIITTETGETFESGNSSDLAKLLAKFENDYSRKKILDYFHTQFGYEHYARRMVDIYSHRI
jgi:glycosyltransferase involved in cell wall biosynthesis